MNKLMVTVACAAILAHAASAAYVELESIAANGGGDARGNNGGAFVNLHYIPSATDSYELDVQMRELEWKQGLLCSRGLAEKDSAYALYVRNDGGVYKPYIGRATSSGDKVNAAIAPNADYVFAYDGYRNRLSVNGEVVAAGSECASSSAYHPNGYMILFGSHNYRTNFSDTTDGDWWKVTEMSTMKFRSLKIWNRFGRLLHWYVPAQDTSESDESLYRYGVYDKMTGEYWANMGKSAFEPGAPVADAGWLAVSSSGPTDGAMDPMPGVQGLADGASVTATATDFTNEVSGVKFTCTGYTIQSSDAAGNWSAPAFHEGKSVPVVGSGTTKTRVVWQWKREVRVGEGEDAAWVEAKDAATVKALTLRVQDANAEVVEVESGYYLLDEPLAIGKANVTIKGATGNPADVVLDGQGRTRLVYANWTDQNNLTVSGLTFRHARTTFKSNWAGMEANGGAIRFCSSVQVAVGGHLVTNCVFSDCHSDYGNGGAISMLGGSTVADCVFTNCTSALKGTDDAWQGGTQGGGALHLTAFAADAIVERCSFTACCASNGIGVVGFGDYNTQNNEGNAFNIVLRDCGFTNNWSWGAAGCLGFKCRRVERCSFVGNYALTAAGQPGNGGVWSPGAWRTGHTPRLPSDMPCVFDTCRFEENEAGNGGVFQTSMNVAVVVSNGFFRANKANTWYVGNLNGDAEFVGCEIAESDRNVEYQAYYGEMGVLSLYGPHSRVVGCHFHDNRFYSSVGVLTIGNGTGNEVINCRFEREVCPDEGHKTGVLVVKNLQLVNGVTIRGCLFANCTNLVDFCTCVLLGDPNQSSGVTAGPENAVVENCTFAGNRSFIDNLDSGSKRTRRGTVYAGQADNAAIIRNCLFSDNLADNGQIRNFAAGDAGYPVADLATYCWEDGAQLQTGDGRHNVVGTNPRFVDVAAGNYRLGGGTCANKGLNLPWMAAATDLDGNPRIIGSAVDFGCYERDVDGFYIVIR